MPDAIQFIFIPITSLLRDVSGKGFLSQAINPYLRHKPPIADLQYFLDFQAHKIWAQVLNELALGPASNRATQSPAIHVCLLSPQLYVNTVHVGVANRPVMGMSLYIS
ncbi:hypothetical protein C1H46_041496 [Malus baccata]|uniref:Uncharacterized protein n=1 Tax=Malus baccata TaxID=106549 RepID=A0A540KFH9_MALBA|nr:hypothetical protein C1H46_041496 [Malus baccata]